MRIFLTGAHGFVGRQLSSYLQEVGHEILGLSPPVDVTCAADLHSSLSRSAPDAIIHLAAISAIPESREHPLRTCQVNYFGALNLLRAVSRQCPAARVLLVGSGSQYGTLRGARPTPFVEDSPFRCSSPYAQTKAAADLLGQFHAERGLSIVRPRPFNHTGAGQSDAFSASSFARQIAEIKLGLRPAEIEVGELESTRDFLHVHDVLRAYELLLDPEIPADAYNIASGSPVRVGEILELLMQISGCKAKIIQTKDRLRPPDHSAGNADRLRQITGWAPCKTLRATLEEILEDWTHRLQIRQ